MAGEANSVTLSTNFNVDPFYDDFNETKNYHRVLFRPGLAVQARELTQMQSILQNQIDRFAEHIFKEGSTIRGFEMNYDLYYNYVRVRDRNSTGTSISPSDFIGKTLRGRTSGVTALVINTHDGSEANTPHTKTLYVKYQSANTSGRKYFTNNEILISTDGSGLSANTIVGTIANPAEGHGVAITFNAGIVYAKDHFIRVPSQTIVASKYDTMPNVRVGFDIKESIVTEVDDSTLLDPASGSYNYAAPGAARLKLEVALSSVPLTSTVSNTFIELIQIKDGVVQSISNRTQYSQIRDYMAKRTSDESGDYIISGLGVSVKEHLKVGNNQGVYASPTGDSTKLVVVVDPGKSYVKGYDNERIVSTRSTMSKATDYLSVKDAQALVDYGNYIIVDCVAGKWDLAGQSIVNLKDNQSNSVTRLEYSSTWPAGGGKGATIGTARVKGIEYYTGVPGAPNALYKLYLTDIKMNAGKNFLQVQGIAYNANTPGKADVRYLSANTQDSSSDISVFRLPTLATKQLRSTTGTINNNFQFYKVFSQTTDTSGVATLNTGDDNQTFDGGGSYLSQTARRSDFHAVVTSAANTVAAGSVSISLAGNTVTGAGGSAFATKINVGDVLHIGIAGDLIVSEVVSDTSLKVLGTAAGAVASGKYYKKFISGQVVDLGGYGGNGARTLQISSTPARGATINLNETFNTTGAPLNVIAKVNQNDGQEIAKSVIRNRLVQIRMNAGGGTSYTANTTGPWPLGLSDGFKLVSVRKKTGSNFSTVTDGTDVTNYFSIDTGMRDNYYDHARLGLKTPGSLSIGTTDRLLVTFDHFTHSHSSGVGFFSVDSYPVNDATAGTDTSKIYTYEIPLYSSPTNGLTYDLRDSLDIRPRIADTANSVTGLTGISINPLTSTTFYNPTGLLKFSPPNQDFTTDADYYLRRTDTVAISKSGDIEIIRGAPAPVRAAAPAVPEDMMAIATITLAPYPSLPAEIARRINRPDLSNTLRRLRNERYTMRDIGTIRDRVDRLEYYTSLNLLEKNAKDLLIPDVNGNDRFKNGIIVDSFKGYSIANPFDNDLKFTVDPAKGEMRPLTSLDNIALVYTSNSANVVRTNVTPSGVSRDQIVTVAGNNGMPPGSVFFNTPSPHYHGFVSSGSVTGIFKTWSTMAAGTATPGAYRIYVEEASDNFTVGGTLTYTRATDGGTISDGSVFTATILSVTPTTPGDLVTVPYTHAVFVGQPYATTTRNCVGTFYNWRGTLVITPDSDYWCDTTARPDVNINLDLNTDNWLWLANAWQTQWSAYETVFTGKPILVGTSEVDQGTVNVPQADGSTNIVQNYLTNNIYTTPTIQARSGLVTNATVVQSTQTIGNFVRDVNIQPFMRSRMIICSMSGMKGSSRIYGFFDNVDVNRYITPLTAAEYASGLKNSAGVPQKPAAVEGSALYTNADGTAYCIYRLPSDNSLRFRTGTKRLRFVDNPTNSGVFGQFTTMCETDYTSEGLAAGVSDLTLSTKRAIIAQTLQVQTQNVDINSGTSTTGQRVIGNIPVPQDAGDAGGGGASNCGGGCGSDPIAQTMLISALISRSVRTSGIYLTKLDLFFATKDNTLPITIELREVDPATGAVTPRVVPFSRVIMQPADINLSDDASAATPVYFPSPVYLGEDKEYAMVLIPGATNPNYNAFTAVLGEKDIITKSRVSQQPAAGFLFTSANQRTWVPVENEDLKFVAYYAIFDTINAGNLIVKNENRDYLTIANTTGAFNKVGELVYGEQLLVGTFSNTKSVNTSGTLCYAMGVTTNATGIITSYSTSSIRIRRNSINNAFRSGEVINLYNTAPTGSATPVLNKIGTTTAVKSITYPVGRAVYYDVVNYANTKLHIANTTYANSGPANSANRMFVKDYWITGQTNGYSARIVSIDNIIMDNMNLQTNMIQPSNTAITAYGKFAKSTSTRDTVFNQVLINDTTEFDAPRYILSRSNEANTSSSSATMGKVKSGEILYSLDCRNSVASPAIDLSRLSIVATHNLISSNAEIGSSEDWVKSGGNSKTRYITRRVTLADGQDAEDLRVYLSAYLPPGAQVSVYAKILNGDDSDLFADARWIPMSRDDSQGFTLTTAYSSSVNRDNFIEFAYNMPNYPTTAITDTSGRAINQYGANNSTGIVEYRNSSKATFQRFKYFAIKVILTNSTSTNPPRVHELRAIALQR